MKRFFWKTLLLAAFAGQSSVFALDAKQVLTAAPQAHTATETVINRLRAARTPEHYLEGFEALRLHLADNPGDARVWCHLAICSESLGDHAAAETSLKIASILRVCVSQETDFHVGMERVQGPLRRRIEMAYQEARNPSVPISPMEEIEGALTALQSTKIWREGPAAVMAEQSRIRNESSKPSQESLSFVLVVDQTESGEPASPTAADSPAGFSQSDLQAKMAELLLDPLSNNDELRLTVDRIWAANGGAKISRVANADQVDPAAMRLASEICDRISFVESPPSLSWKLNGFSNSSEQDRELIFKLLVNYFNKGTAPVGKEFSSNLRTALTILSVDTAASIVQVTPPPVIAGKTCTFRGVDSQASPVARYEWDFDYSDKKFDVDATGETVNKSFEGVGVLVVALRITTANGASGIATMTVDVQPKPVGQISDTQPKTESPIVQAESLSCGSLSAICCLPCCYSVVALPTCETVFAPSSVYRRRSFRLLCLPCLTFDCH